jgi:hypothetical protein
MTWSGRHRRLLLPAVTGGLACVIGLLAGCGSSSSTTTTSTAVGSPTSSSSRAAASLSAITPPASSRSTTAPAPSPTARTAAPAPRPPAKTTARPPATTPAPRPSTQVVLSTCGAPANPWGYNFCGRGSYIYNPSADVCSYFSCIANFTNGSGYMIQCTDGTYSMSGGHRGACSYHGGEARPVYSGSGPH